MVVLLSPLLVTRERLTSDFDECFGFSPIPGFSMTEIFEPDDGVLNNDKENRKESKWLKRKSLGS